MSEEAKPAGIISIDEFDKVDIRAGLITSAERVTQSKKLLKLQVSFGEELGTRQVVAGIGKSYDPDSLVGQVAAFVVNLAPRKLMNLDELESNGMILAVKAGSGVEIMALRNSEHVVPGTRIG